MKMDKQTKERIALLSKKYNKEESELSGRLTELYQEYKEAHPERGDATLKTLARRQLILELRSARRTRRSAGGEEYQGFIFGADRLRDRISNYHDVYAKNASKLRPGVQVTDKATGLAMMLDDEGNRMDMRKQVKGRDNWGFGKILPAHDYHRVICGVASTGDNPPQWFSAHVYGDHAAEITQDTLFTPVKFQASGGDRTGDNGEILLIVKTAPEPDLSLQLSVEDAFEFCESIELGTQSRAIELGDIEDYIDELWDEQWSTPEFLVQVDVDSIWPADPKNGRMYFVDESLEFLDDELDSIMGWYNDKAPSFAEGSRLILCASAFRKKQWDRELQMETDEWGDPQINILGWYAIPELLVPAIDMPEAGGLEDGEEE
jgi:hypothetical protein